MYICVMIKYRITSETRSDSTKNNVVYYIERKKWFGWRKIRIDEDVKTTILCFNTYKEAEAYLTQNYIGDGYYYNPYPNEYHYMAYSYYV